MEKRNRLINDSETPDGDIIDQATTWNENNQTQKAIWRSPRWPAPIKIELADDQISAATATRRLRDGTALLWRGDYHNARQVLQAIARRLEGRPQKSGPDLLRERFHRGRLRQAQQAAVLARLLVPLAGARIALARAPDAAEALEAALGPLAGSGLLPLRELLGIIGAWQWRVRGVPVPALDDAKVYPHYGVFAPVRSEYLDLVAKAPLPPNCRLAIDVGTGTGVMAAILARRGVSRVIATDTSVAAVATASDTAQRLGLGTVIDVREQDMFPEAEPADLIVCNPPWLPGKVANALDAAIYDPDSRMLRAFLAGLAPRLAVGGEGWLIMSDLAERLGLREPEALDSQFAEAGLRVLERHHIKPRHRRAQDAADPLHEARAAEVVSLWRLIKA
ncbi:MAG: methyltransferase [Pigmentiphaga sp.]